MNKQSLTDFCKNNYSETDINGTVYIIYKNDEKQNFLDVWSQVNDDKYLLSERMNIAFLQKETDTIIQDMLDEIHKWNKTNPNYRVPKQDKIFEMYDVFLKNKMLKFKDDKKIRFINSIIDRFNQKENKENKNDEDEDDENDEDYQE